MAEYDQGNLDKIKTTDGSRPPSMNRGTLHWFAYVGPDPPFFEDDREFRIKQVKERQNEERQRKLDEIKCQALAAQKFKEQKENERRQRIEEMKIKDEFRRQQVEERKKAINDAERDRLESILRRNQEREARIESRRRNDKSSNVFAFGSSTPRMLEPVDSIGSFWGHRRATSTQNIMCSVPFTRRQSERETDGGCKKRATSAGGLECSGEDMRMSTSMYEIFDRGTNISIPAQTSSASNIFGTPTIAAGCASGYLGRRRTDLMPTIPSRDRDSFSSTPRKSFARSPGRAYSMTRLDQLAKPRRKPSDLPPLSESPTPLSKSQQSSVSRSMSHLAFSKQATNQPQKNLRKSDSMQQLPLILPRPTRAMQLRQQKLNATLVSTQSEASSRPSSSLSHQSTSSVTSSVNMRTKPIAAPRRPRPASIAVTGITVDKNGTPEPKKQMKPPLPKTRHSTVRRSQEKLENSTKKTERLEKKKKMIASPTTETVQHLPVMHSPVENKIIEQNVENIEQEDTKEPVVSNIENTVNCEMTNENITVTQTITSVATDIEPVKVNKIENESQKLIDSERANGATNNTVTAVNTNGLNEATTEIETFRDTSINDQNNKENTDHNNKDISNKEISAKDSGNKEVNNKEVNNKDVNNKDINVENVNNLEENAMTKSRITTEEEAKAALAERRRLAREEAERQAEMERLKREEEARLEFERQQREEEAQRVLIEQQRAAEQERLQEAIREAQRKEEEEKQRREEEQRLKILKEEAERKAREEAERQKIELQERLKNEEKEREARRKRVEAIMLRTRGKNNSSTPQQNDEKIDESTKMNGSKLSSELNSSDNNSTEITHKNGKDVETVDNLIPVDSIKNANTVNIDSLSSDDNLNSNNSWQHNTQTDLLM